MSKHGVYLVLIAVLLAPRLLAQWVELPGIEGGRVSAFLASGENMFAATQGGDIYVSRDSGARWSVSYSGQTSYGVCLAQMGSVVFAGGLNTGIIRSSDGGISWAKSDSGLPAGVHSLLSYDTLLYATTHQSNNELGSIYVSADTGRHWTLIGPDVGVLPDGATTFRNMTTIARKGDVLCAGSTDSMFRSTDGGMTWKPMINGPWCCTSIVADSSRFYAGSPQGEVFYSTDNGESWILGYTFPDTNTYPWDGPYVYQLAIRNGALYAVGDPGMYRSTDQGVTWAELGELQRHYANGFATYTTYTAVYSTSGYLYVAASYGGIFRSTDNGISWIESNRGFLDVDVTAFAIENQSVYAVAPRVGFFRSDDNGDSWISALPGEDLRFTSITAGGKNIFIGTQSGVYRSVDRGSTWKLSNNLGYIKGLHLLDDKLYAFVQEKGVFVSSDSAKTWTAINNGLSNLNTVSFAGHGSKLFVGTSDGLFLSTDAGGHWVPTSKYINPFAVYILALMKEEIYAVIGIPAGGNPRLLRSADDGATWLVADNGLSRNDVLSALHIEDSLVFVLAGDKIALSMNEGTSWKYCYTNPPFGAGWGTRVSLGSNDQYFFIVGWERSILRAPLANLLTGIQSPGDVGLPTRILLMQNYPNPFNPSTTIGYSLHVASHVTLTVYNPLGQSVAELLNGDVNAGHHEVQFSATGLSSGVYFYRLKAGDFVQTRKLLLVR